MPKVKVPYPLVSLACEGEGKAWVAECRGHFVSGDPKTTKYLKPTPQDPDVYLLEAGKVYYCNEPRETGTSVVARRYHLFVGHDGALEELNAEEAAAKIDELAMQREYNAMPENLFLVADLVGDGPRGDMYMTLNSKGLHLQNSTPEQAIQIPLSKAKLRAIFQWISDQYGDGTEPSF